MAVKRMYEAMFLFDSSAGGVWEKVEEQINRLMERAGGEMVCMKKWDDRRLTYEVAKKKRGTYVLAFFRAPTDSIVGLERDVQLSEEILRVLVIRRDKMTDEKARENLENSQAYVPVSFGETPGRWEGGGGQRRERAPYHRQEAAEETSAEVEEGEDEVNA